MSPKTAQICTNFDNFPQKDGKEAENYARCTHFPPHLIRVTTLPTKKNGFCAVFRHGVIMIIIIFSKVRHDTAIKQAGYESDTKSLDPVWIRIKLDLKYQDLDWMRIRPNPKVLDAVQTLVAKFP